jgi:hypothetical protein
MRQLMPTADEISHPFPKGSFIHNHNIINPNATTTFPQAKRIGSDKSVF